MNSLWDQYENEIQKETLRDQSGRKFQMSLPGNLNSPSRVVIILVDRAFLTLLWYVSLLHVVFVMMNKTDVTKIKFC